MSAPRLPSTQSKCRHSLPSLWAQVCVALGHGERPVPEVLRGVEERSSNNGARATVQIAMALVRVRASRLERLSSRF